MGVIPTADGDVPSILISIELVANLRFCGILSLGVTFVSMLMLFVYLGACNVLPPFLNWCPLHESEPMPRAVRWTYPEDLLPHQRHWFLVHVAQTRLVKGQYVASISQYVGARGTSGAKLMLMACTAAAVCQMQTAYMLFRIEQLLDGGDERPVTSTRCLLQWTAAISLMLLGLAESALDWQTTPGGMVKKDDNEIPGLYRSATGMAFTDVSLPPQREDMDGEGEDGEGQAKKPPLQRAVSVYTEADEAQGKSVMRLMHMLAAFSVVGFNVAAQWVGPHRETRLGSVITVTVGLIAFLIFCIMQWLSGANDEFIPPIIARFRAREVAYTMCAPLRPYCFCPPGFQYDPTIDPVMLKKFDWLSKQKNRTLRQSRVVCASWWFISVEIVAFIALTATTAIEALTLNTSGVGAN